jgi:zinc transport system ATP-binding protein
MVMIEICNLFFSYNKNQPYTLNNINLKIDKGQYISILGENGSGKSTLMKLILKLLKPNAGKIKVDTTKIGYVPQLLDSFNSAFPITIEEILKCHLKALKLRDTNSIHKALEIVGMGEYKKRLIGNLSGGQRQKIFIARALMGYPELLILDEPSTGVDIKSQREIYSLLKDLNKTKNITIISVEHNLKAAIENSTHIFKLDKGKGTILRLNDYVKSEYYDEQSELLF